MPDVDSAHALLEALAILRLGGVDRGALLDALAEWGLDPRRRLTEVLDGRGALGRSARLAVDSAVDSALGAHGGDVWAALGAAGPVPDDLMRQVAPDGSSFYTFGTDLKSAGAISHDSSWWVGLADSGDATDRTEPATAPGAGPETLGRPSSSADETVTRGVGPDPFSTLTAPPDDPDATRPVDGTPADPGGYETVALGSPGGDGRAGPRDPPGGDGAGSAGRFRILRPHARGGLGQVYVARDEELNRDVALKEILGGQADHENSRARFLIEAEVTGGLEHPGIVPVYGLGKYPDGRPYYAMRFIRGRSMKEAISRHHEPEASRRRPPAERGLELRQLLNQLIDVCNAMSYAHSRGVLHRDLKPGNVMLGAFGETLVVDWGLAKFKDDAPAGPVPDDDPVGPLRPVSANVSSRTLYGTTVGTPQFMSPEQALGKLDELGPQSDVYSLGAILYMILTGAVAFPDRHLHVVLDKVRRGDFPPPRALDGSVDPALNAVCLKAMALDIGRRYPTADALADDLERWLADEPVGAYREALPKRVWRWARRHRTAVSALAALLITATVSLGVYSALIRREQQRTLRFYVLAHDAVDRMLTEFGEEDLADIPQMEPVRKRMLGEARRFYEALQRERGAAPGDPAELAAADLRLGEIQMLLGEDRGAEGRFGRAIGALNGLTPPGPSDRSTLARAYHARGVLRRHLNRVSDAEADLKRAMELRDALVRESPGDLSRRRDRVESLYQLAALQASLDRDAEAKQSYEEVIREQSAIAEAPGATEDDRRRLGRYLNNQANLLKKSAAAPAEAEGLYRRAATIQKRVARESPAPVAVYEHELAKTYANLHNLLAGRGAFEEAEGHALKGLALGRRLAADFRKTPEFQFQFASATLDRGEIQRRRRRFDEARKDLDEAIARAEPLTIDQPGRRRYQSVLALAHLNRGALSFDEGRDEDAADDFRRAADLYDRLTSVDEPLPEDRRDLGRARSNLATALVQGNRPVDAEAQYRDAIKALKPLVETETPSADDLRDLGDVYRDLAVCLARVGPDHLDAAHGALDGAIELHERAEAAGAAPGDVPPLWRDLRFKVDWLRSQRRYVEVAETSARLPGLRPGHPDSLLIAARGLAACAFPAVHAGAADAEGLAKGYADRAVAALRDWVGRSGADARALEAELKINLYLPVRDRGDVRALLQGLRDREGSEGPG